MSPTSPEGPLPARLLLLSHDAQANGAQRAAADTAAALTDAGVDVHVLVEGSGPLLTYLDSRITVHQGRVGTWARGGRAPLRLRAAVKAALTAWRVRQLVRQQAIELVISNTALVAGGWLGAAAARRPHVWWLHEDLDRRDHLPLLVPVPLLKRLIARTGHVLVPTRSLAERCRWLPATRVHLVRPTVRPPLLGRAEQDPDAAVHTILFPGGTLRVKRPLDVLHAYLKLQERDAVRLRLVGPDGPDRRHFEAARAALGGDDVVPGYQGFVPDLADELGPGVVLVSAGGDESFGRVLVEALHAGSVVVAAAAGATPEVLGEPEPAGVLYDVGDVDALADALHRVVTDADLRRDLVTRGHQRALAWSAAQHVADVAKAWSRISLRGAP